MWTPRGTLFASFDAKSIRIIIIIITWTADATSDNIVNNKNSVSMHPSASTQWFGDRRDEHIYISLFCASMCYHRFLRCRSDINDITSVSQLINLHKTLPRVYCVDEMWLKFNKEFNELSSITVTLQVSQQRLMPMSCSHCEQLPAMDLLYIVIFKFNSQLSCFVAFLLLLLVPITRPPLLFFRFVIETNFCWRFTLLSFMGHRAMIAAPDGPKI